jgi:hypothetical protein
MTVCYMFNRVMRDCEAVGELGVQRRTGDPGSKKVLKSARAENYNSMGCRVRFRRLRGNRRD